MDLWWFLASKGNSALHQPPRNPASLAALSSSKRCATSFSCSWSRGLAFSIPHPKGFTSWNERVSFQQQARKTPLSAKIKSTLAMIVYFHVSGLSHHQVGTRPDQGNLLERFRTHWHVALQGTNLVSAMRSALALSILFWCNYNGHNLDVGLGVPYNVYQTLNLWVRVPFVCYWRIAWQLVSMHWLWIGL